MADLEVKYGTKTNLTITVASLADGSARESTSVSNGTNKFQGVQVGGFIQANSSGVSATGYVNVFAYGSVDDGTTNSDAATGTDSAHTLEDNAILLGRVSLNANSQVAQFGPFSLESVFNGMVPEDWGIIIENQSGAALDSTGGNHEIHYKGLKTESV